MKALSLLFAVAGLWLLPRAAEAKCESFLTGIEGFSGDQLVAAYKKVLTCDTKVAQQVFPQFMRVAGDADTLVALSLTAIDADVWNPVWEMIGKLSSYDARDEVALRVGAACASDPKVVGFLQGAYFGLRDIDFQQWDDALLTCEAPAFHEWLVKQVSEPPPKLYDDKWSALANALVKREQRDSLPLLADAAVKAAGNGGPFEAILMLMEAAVAPPLGEEMSADDRAALEGALVGMARNVDAEKARSVADRLANSGSDARAAELLPAVYPGREQGGAFWYGVASVEAGVCEGERQAVVHYALVANPSLRWLILPAVEEPIRQVKPRLSKCTMEEPWPVLVSPEPFASKGAIGGWVSEIAKEWEGRGYEAKTREEKEIRLQ